MRDSGEESLLTIYAGGGPEAHEICARGQRDQPRMKPRVALVARFYPPIRPNETIRGRLKFERTLLGCEIFGVVQSVKARQ
jgi:hypothetical protein